MTIPEAIRQLANYTTNPPYDRDPQKVTNLLLIQILDELQKIRTTAINSDSRLSSIDPKIEKIEKAVGNINGLTGSINSVVERIDRA